MLTTYAHIRINSFKDINKIHFYNSNDCFDNGSSDMFSFQEKLYNYVSAWRNRSITVSNVVITKQFYQSVLKYDKYSFIMNVSHLTIKTVVQY